MRSVFKFTFVQHTSSNAYRLATFIIALVLMFFSVAGFIIADNYFGEDDISDIDKVYVCDTSILSGTDYNVFHEYDDELKKVQFVQAAGSDPEKAAEEAAADGEKSCVLEVKNMESGSFMIRVIKPEGFVSEKKSAKHLAKYIRNNLRYVIFEKADLSDDQKQELLTDTEIKMSVAGENSVSSTEETVKMAVPAVFGLFLYIMLCIYGQGIARSVVIEKDSKMMETLLVMVKPYDLIFGKIFGMYLAAIFQIAVWMAALAAGISIGISSSGSTGKKVKEFIGILAEKGGFSVSAVALAAVALFVGFLLYVALAAFAGTFAAKTEEINNYFGVYTMVVVICWVFPYMNQINGNAHVLSILRYIPFTAPFAVPADVLIGTVSIPMGIVSTFIMAVSTVLVVFFAARVYKALVLYRGEAPKIRDVLKMIK